MHIIVVGLNHRVAPVELRERLAFRNEQLPQALARLRTDVGLHEATILSTCNRVELYAGVPELDGTIEHMQQFLSEHGRIAIDSLAPRLYSYIEPESIQHLFCVASGLDSMVLGEAEILHQVKSAYESARAMGATGKVFNVLFQRAFNAAKAVRTKTTIGQGRTSIGTVAVELAEDIFGTLSDTTVALLGAGKMGELTLKQLTDCGVGEVRIINRSLARAAAIASPLRAQAFGLERLAEQLREADILISAAATPSYLVSPQDVEVAMRLRHHRPLCFVDLGVPRNVDPQVGSLENVYLFDVDDLQDIVERTHAVRREAVEASEAILRCKVEHFLAWWDKERMGCVPAFSEVVEAP